jgi:hypothetical protein
MRLANWSVLIYLLKVQLLQFGIFKASSRGVVY